jgi:hypothetical protein
MDKWKFFGAYHPICTLEALSGVLMKMDAAQPDRPALGCPPVTLPVHPMIPSAVCTTCRHCVPYSDVRFFKKILGAAVMLQVVFVCLPKDVILTL